jgi:hypothetical protein
MLAATAAMTQIQHWEGQNPIPIPTENTVTKHIISVYIALLQGAWLPADPSTQQQHIPRKTNLFAVCAHTSLVPTCLCCSQHQ